MATNSQVLREYLLSLGFKIDTQQEKKWKEAFTGTTRLANAAGAGVVGFAATAAAAMAKYVYSMDKAYFASKRIGVPIAQLERADYAGRSIGLGAGQMQKAFESLAHTLRTQPGTLGLIKSFGVKTEGRNVAQQAIDLVRELRKMPYQLGAKFAQDKFGIPEETFLVLSQNLDEYEALVKKREEIDKMLGNDADANAKAMNDWAQAVRDVKTEYEAIQHLVVKLLLPKLQELPGVMREVASSWNNIGEKTKGGWWDTLTRFLEGVDNAVGFNSTGGGVELSESSKRRIAGATQGQIPNSMGDDARAWFRKTFPGFSNAGGGRGWVNPPNAAPGAAGGAAAAPGDDFQAYLGQLEQKYGLPKGVLDALWAQESSRGKNLTSRTGVQGDFQITKATGALYGGWSADRNVQADQAARILADNLKRRNGSLFKALTEYNAGGRIAENPELGTNENRNYAPSIMRRMEQNIHITVNGGNPEKVRAGVLGAMEKANGNLIRELDTKVQ